jgi:hypothetical protein
MFDISIPWSVILLMAPILMPFLSIPGALLAGFGWYWRKKSFYAALVAAVVGAFAAPWAALLVIATVERLKAWSDEATPLLIGAAWVVGVLAIVGLVLWGASHADSRRRGRN